MTEPMTQVIAELQALRAEVAEFNTLLRRFLVCHSGSQSRTPTPVVPSVMKSDDLCVSRHEANTQRVVRFIRQQGGRASYRDIMRAVRSIKARDLKDLLDGMCQAELIERAVMDPKRPQGGGRPLNEFRLRAA